MLVNLQKDARMAKGGGDAMARAITSDSAGMDAKNLGRCLHGKPVSIGRTVGQYGPRAGSAWISH